MWDEGVQYIDNGLENLTRTDSRQRILSYTQAIREAFRLILDKSSEAIILGQGVTDPHAMFGTTADLSKIYGRDRVFDTPVSEDSLTGFCIGAAMNGLRPIYMHNRPDFLLLAMNQLISHAAKFHYMSNGQTKVPLVIWSAIGRGWGAGAQHSQALQGLFMGIPGLKIVMPSTPHDAKGLIISAYEDNNPVLIFEHRWTMKNKGPVPSGYYKVPIGKAVVRRKGTDVTVVGCSHAIQLAQVVSEALWRESNISAEVIDLRSLQPLDEDAILESVKKTGRLVVVDTGWSKAGVCAEIASLVAEKTFAFLKGPIRRVGLPHSPTPASHIFENEFYPEEKNIREAILQTLKR